MYFSLWLTFADNILWGPLWDVVAKEEWNNWDDKEQHVQFAVIGEIELAYYTWSYQINRKSGDSQETF